MITAGTSLETERARGKSRVSAALMGRTRRGWHSLAVALAGSFVAAAGALAQDITTLPDGAPAGPDPLAVHRLQQIIFHQAAERLAASVVTIETIGGTQPDAAPPSGPAPRDRQRRQGQPGRPARNPQQRPEFIIADGPTTGLIWSKDGLILTSAFNFVRDPSVITVVLPDGRRFVGELLARDEVRRLAMVKIDAKDLPVPDWVENLQDIQVGQWSLVLGRGFGGKEPTVSAGIVSGLNRKGGLAIQTDAKLSPANFGGPLIDIQGRVIGLCVPMGMGAGLLAGVEWYDSGIGFAVPRWQVIKSAESLALGHNLRRGLLGVRMDPKAKKGVRIGGMGDPSPALRGGLRIGDVILALDGRPVAEYPDLLRIMSARLAGEKVMVRVQRDQEQLEIPVVLAVPEDIGEVASGEEEEPQTQPAESQPEGE